MICIIGAGKLGSVIAKRLSQSEEFHGSVIVSDRNSEKVAALEGVEAAESPIEAARKSGVVILCVKPKDMQGILGQIGAVCAGKLVISVAAGISIAYLQARAPGARVVRCLPNLAAGIGMSDTGMAFSKNATGEDREIAGKISGLLGNFQEIDEKMMAAWTGLSGSHPAYVALCIDAAAKAAQDEGFDRKTAVRIASQVMLASAKLLLETGEDPLELVGRVASKGGTTEAGLKKSEEMHLPESYRETVTAAIKRAKEMEI